MPGAIFACTGTDNDRKNERGVRGCCGDDRRVRGPRGAPARRYVTGPWPPPRR